MCDDALASIASVRACSLEAGLEQLPDVAVPLGICQAAAGVAAMAAGAGSDGRKALGPIADAGLVIRNIGVAATGHHDGPGLCDPAIEGARIVGGRAHPA